MGRPRKDLRDPAVVMRETGFEPMEPYPGTALPWGCRHEAGGREVTPRLGNVSTGRQGGCRFCEARHRPPDEAAALMRRGGRAGLASVPESREA